METPNQIQMTVMDRLIEEALEKARKEAIEAIFGRFHEDSVIREELRKLTLEYLKTPEGHARIVDLANKAIDQLMVAQPKNRW